MGKKFKKKEFEFNAVLPWFHYVQLPIMYFFVSFEGLKAKGAVFRVKKILIFFKEIWTIFFVVLFGFLVWAIVRVIRCDGYHPYCKKAENGELLE